MKKTLFKKIVLVLMAVILVNLYWGCKDRLTETRLEMMERQLQQEKHDDEIQKLQQEIKQLKAAQQKDTETTAVQNQ